MIDSVYRTGKKYYPQMFTEALKYVIKEKMMPEYILLKVIFKVTQVISSDFKSS